MCGVFGFVSYEKNVGPDMTTLRKIARVTESRGEHAFGFAWLDWAGRVRMFKRSGRVSQSIGLLDMARNARVLIGHCRWATHGSSENNSNNHPHPADGGWIVHNGVVSNHEDLAAEYDLWPTTACDSEVLGLLIAGTGGKLVERCAATANVARGPLVMLGVWTHPARLVAVRRGNPLSIGEVNGGEQFYLGSLPAGLPGKVAEVPDRTVVEFTPTTMTKYDVKGEPSRLRGE
jgi:glucosamine--fructose-6-phosphate aminotransferase (isomerizing)